MRKEVRNEIAKWLGIGFNTFIIGSYAFVSYFASNTLVPDGTQFQKAIASAGFMAALRVLHYLAVIRKIKVT